MSHYCCKTKALKPTCPSRPLDIREPPAQNYISHENSACDREVRLTHWPLMSAYYCRTGHAIAFPTAMQLCYLQLYFLCQQCGLGMREPALLTQHNLCNTVVAKMNPSSCQCNNSAGFTFHSAFTAQQ